jgi:hypothetical protein
VESEQRAVGPGVFFWVGVGLKGFLSPHEIDVVGKLSKNKSLQAIV